MSEPIIHAPVQPSSVEQIPAEWLTEFEGLAVGSYERAEFEKILGTLGVGAAAELIVDPEINDRDASSKEKEPTFPGGFVSMKIVHGGATIPTKQFEGIIASLDTSEDTLETNVIELESDTGNKIRVVDLRSNMSESMSKVGPKSETEKKRLSDAFWRDMKIYCDTGSMRNTVTDVSKVCYTRAGDTKLRSYWMAIKDTQNTGNIRTVARLADSGNNAGLEARLYRKLFAITM